MHAESRIIISKKRVEKQLYKEQNSVNPPNKKCRSRHTVIFTIY